ncbi:hypothetical protein ACGFYU_03190 [Streptomyces sp. NPDC048337]|uniref:hypothetical protein n=1 Tax=Streptomyces sp. NPDC048337 TaxID=3365535 RepID=UPI0037224224
MDIGIFLLALGLASAIPGGWIALNVRGSAASLERRASANAELRMHARGSLGPPPRVASAGVFRFLATAVGLAGSVLTLAGLAELLG